MKGKKLFVFWIVWPHDKNAPAKVDSDKTTQEEDSDGEDGDAKETETVGTQSALKHKDLKQVVFTCSYYYN